MLLSANRVDFDPYFFVSYIFQFYPPPPQLESDEEEHQEVVDFVESCADLDDAAFRQICTKTSKSVRNGEGGGGLNKRNNIATLEI